MKNLIIAITILFSSILAQATSLAPHVEYSRFDLFNVNHVRFANFADGNIAIDYFEDTLTLTIFQSPVCGPDMVCATVMPAPQIITLPIISSENNGCGAIYVAEGSDAFGEEVERITLTDYRNATCEIALNHLTHVEYSTFSFSDTPTISSFYGHGLEFEIDMNLPVNPIDPFPTVQQ